MSNEAPTGTTAINTSIAHPARRYDYWLGGKDNFAVDRASGDAIAAAFPEILTAVRENRHFLRRAITQLAQAGVTQYIDLGTGIPTSPNTHEVAQAIQPEAHVLYVDNDPMVLAHARALLTSAPSGRTSYLDADIRDPGRVLAAAVDTLDCTEPIAVLAVAVWHFLSEDDDPRAVLRAYLDALPTGSYLVFSHATLDDQPAVVNRGLEQLPAEQLGAFHPRSRADVAELLTGLHVIEPGIVPTSEWRRDPTDDLKPVPLAEAAAWAAVARIAG
ncbi:SAM-dependent methyltransferase [Cryptosporangium sp. NPDC048952]|uniref:SAM-dependent methyltransferase n=1 Tax=Cryptosporangium sp. NPDC048952 TaxID=3363961 RepID=UPI00371A6BB2